MHKTVLITGSSRGIGKAIAIEYAKNNYNVIINSSKSESELLKTCEYIKTFDVKCLPILTDVSNYQNVSEMFDKIYENFKKIDVVVNNAGISCYGLFTDTTPTQWQHLISTNLTSIYNVLQLAIPNMIHHKDGKIINISSIWGIEGASCEVAYSATKGAINSLTKALSKELGPSHIRVNAIACGAIETTMNHWMDSEDRSSFCEDISLCRFGSPDEVAKLAYYLGNDTSSYLTGQIIRLDGGM